METTKIIVEIDEKNAILAGSKIYGCVLLDYDPATLTEKQRETIASLGTRDGYCVDRQMYTNVNFRWLRTQLGVVRNDLLPQILDEYAAKIERAERENAEREKSEAIRKEMQREAAVQKWLATPDESVADNIEYIGDYHKPDSAYYAGIYYIKSESKTVYLDPRLEDKMSRAVKIYNDRKTRREAERKAAAEKAAAENAAAEKAAAEKAAAKQQQIAAYVAAHGTENQKKRAALSLLPDEEIINQMREEAFAPLADFDRYEKLTSKDVPCWCGDYDDDAPHAKYSVSAADTATAEQFDLMEKIQAALPAAKLTLRLHLGWCEECETPDDKDGNVERYSILVALAVGAFNFTREYAA